MGGGILAGLGYAVVQSALPEHLWAKATALISAMWGIGTLAGTAIGGLFAQFDAWRLAFVVLAVLGLLVAVVVPRALPRGERAVLAEPVPVTSFVLLTATTVLISVASVLERLSAMALACAGAVALMAAFVRWERGAAILTTGMASEAFTPLFGQRLAGLEPFLAAFLGAAVSLGVVGQHGVQRERDQARHPALAARARPAVLATGLAVTGLFQWYDASASRSRT